MNIIDKYYLLKEITEENLIKEEAIFQKEQPKLKEYYQINRLTPHEEISKTAALTSMAQQSLLLQKINLLNISLASLEREFNLDNQDVPSELFEMDNSFNEAFNNLMKTHPIASQLLVEKAYRIISRLGLKIGNNYDENIYLLDECYNQALLNEKEYSTIVFALELKTQLLSKYLAL